MNKTRPRGEPGEHAADHCRRVTIAGIRNLARQIAKKFQPEKIILFGSYAYGTPQRDSDVDLLVIMPTRNEVEQGVRIRQATVHRFSLDLLVRTPRTMQWRLQEDDSFLRDIVERGKVLYEKNHRRVGAKGSSRLGCRKQARSRSTAPS